MRRYLPTSVFFSILFVLLSLLSAKEANGAENPGTEKRVAIPVKVSRLGYADIHQLPDEGENAAGWVLPSRKLKSWFESCQQQIINKMHSSGVEMHSNVSIAFGINSDGTIFKPFIWRSQGTKADDERALALLAAITPFETPPSCFETERLLLRFTYNKPPELRIDLKTIDHVFNNGRAISTF